MRLPMADDDARWFSATDITRLVGAGELEPRAVVRAHLAAIERLDPRIHAYIHVDREARSSPGPYAGVTLAVKDSQPVASIITLRHGRALVYKYGCSDARSHNLGGTALLLWKAIQEAKERKSQAILFAGDAAELGKARALLHGAGLTMPLLF